MRLLQFLRKALAMLTISGIIFTMTAGLSTVPRCGDLENRNTSVCTCCVILLKLPLSVLCLKSFLRKTVGFLPPPVSPIDLLYFFRHYVCGKQDGQQIGWNVNISGFRCDKRALLGRTKYQCVEKEKYEHEIAVLEAHANVKKE